MTTSTPLTNAQLRKLAALIALEPIKHGEVFAALLVSDVVDRAEDEGGLPVAKLRITVPTEWVPPEQDDDGYLCPVHNPYHRALLLPAPADGQAAALNLLDLVTTPDFLPSKAPGPIPAVSGALVIQPRRVLSMAGRHVLMLIGGGVLTFAVQLVNRASQLGAKFGIEEVIIDDREAFERYQPCDVHIDFAFRQLETGQTA